ncbi:MAG: RtcB family protein [Clostridia bacterium]|nr:RtcB family protein [Clostridia bacterium]
MIIEGKYNTAKIFTEVVDEIAVSQIKTLCDSEIFASSKIRVMPDVHAGASCTIGTTMTITDKIIPNMVGVDIGCGMECANLGKVEINLERLDNLIYERIPAGMEVRAVEHEFCAQIDLSKLRCYRNINEYRAKLSIGTLGGGNHFIEVDVDDDGNKYLVVHSGSRHLGTEVAEYYQKEAFRRLSGNSNKQIQELIAKLKEEGRQKEIQSTVNALMAQKPNIPESMAYVENELFDDYVFDMKLVQYFANLNRKAMMREIVDGLNLDVKEQFSTIHNYLDTDYMIMRKGAVSARKGEKLLIPINMRDGALICIGKGNEDWNCSAPHGAGRLLSRGKARATLSVEEFVREMDGIYSTSVNRSTLDESPMAYKSIADIVDNIVPTVDIINRIRPIYNFKSSEQVD